MDDDELKQLERLERAATPGPWLSWVEGRDGGGGDSFIQAIRDDHQTDIYVTIKVADTFHPASAADQDFIAAARNAVPWLIAEVRRLRGNR